VSLAALDLQRCGIQHNIVHIVTSPKIVPFLYANMMDTTARRSRRSRRRSTSPTSPTRVERDKQYYLQMIEEFRAEEERRSRLTLKERMAEDGREIQRRLEREPTMTILLQPSPLRHMRQAQCLVGECPIADTSPQDEGWIMDDY
jgi:hypothetical protein